jgi:hypothetical protein
MFIFLLCPFLSVHAQTTGLSIDISGVPRTGRQLVGYTAQVTASGGSPPYKFGSVPPAGQLLGNGFNIGADSGRMNSGGSLFVSGDFGPIVFNVTDAAGNSAVSVPIFFTISGSNIVHTHFGGIHQCELGLPCTVKQQVVAPIGISPSYSCDFVPPGFTFNTATGVLSGTPTTQGLFGMNVLIQVGFEINNFMQVRVVPPLSLVTAFLQPTCDLGFSFASEIHWLGGWVMDANSRAPTPTLIVSITNGALPPGVRIVQSLAPIGQWQVPKIVGESRLWSCEYDMLTLSVQEYRALQALIL